MNSLVPFWSIKHFILCREFFKQLQEKKSKKNHPSPVDSEIKLIQLLVEVLFFLANVRTRESIKDIPLFQWFEFFQNVNPENIMHSRPPIFFPNYLCNTLFSKNILSKVYYLN